MTEDTHIAPLFKPGLSLFKRSSFVCNINDELSLWRTDGHLRVYTADSLGVWLTEDSLRTYAKLAANDWASRVTPQASDKAKTITRNADALRVYMNMLDHAAAYGDTL